MYSASASSSTEPPVSPIRRAHRLDHLLQRHAEGAQPARVDDDLILAVEAADGGDLGHVGTVFNSNLRNQSCSARSSLMSCVPLRSTSAYS